MKKTVESQKMTEENGRGQQGDAGWQFLAAEAESVIGKVCDPTEERAFRLCMGMNGRKYSEEEARKEMGLDLTEEQFKEMVQIAFSKVLMALPSRVRRVSEDKSDKKSDKYTVPFDPVKQSAVLRRSTCEGERIAGFKDKETGVFTEVACIKDDWDLEEFMDYYNLGYIKKEY